MIAYNSKSAYRVVTWFLEVAQKERPSEEALNGLSKYFNVASVSELGHFMAFDPMNDGRIKMNRKVDRSCIIEEEHLSAHLYRLRYVIC